MHVSARVHLARMENVTQAWRACGVEHHLPPHFSCSSPVGLAGSETRSSLKLIAKSQCAKAPDIASSIVACIASQRSSSRTALTSVQARGAVSQSESLSRTAPLVSLKMLSLTSGTRAGACGDDRLFAVRGA
ncbi:hypothetical protein CAK95_12920 [Pseudorhodoplanes sinuspersici]|uniref:Uncharacterized protein n=1 Tax=Pseudorhodoplanes sinuspersici TaxID=1235591 RepID=A0A1W6ZRD6_9HYPH|nr:hypothetical protein CAK95_12920 [Pseudorhodoplanes sinuspersici]